VLNAAGTALTYSTRVNATLNVIAVDAAGKNIYVAGNGHSTSTTSAGAIQTALRSCRHEPIRGEER
jgi:hypothetical protein